MEKEMKQKEEQEKKENEEAKEKKAKKDDKELDAVKKQLSEKNDQLLRMAAEYDNFRKRSQREREGIYSDAKVNIVKEFLPVIDNLERALQHANDVDEDFK